MLHIATQTRAHARINVISFFGNFNPDEVAEMSPNPAGAHAHPVITLPIPAERVGTDSTPTSSQPSVDATHARSQM